MAIYRAYEIYQKREELLDKIAKIKDALAISQEEMAVAAEKPASGTQAEVFQHMKVMYDNTQHFSTVLRTAESDLAVFDLRTFTPC